MNNINQTIKNSTSVANDNHFTSNPNSFCVNPNHTYAEVNILHFQFTEYGKNAKLWMRKCILLLPEIAKNRVWEKKNFGSIYEYTAKLAGMSRNKVDEALRIMEKVEDKPELKKVIEEKGIWAVKPVVSIATEKTDKFWAEKAREMSQHTLETYVRENSRQSVDGDSRRAANLKTVIMELKFELAEKLNKLNKNNDWNEVIEELLKIREEKLDSEKPEPVEATSRHIPAKIEKFVAKRSAETCEFPGCTKKAEILHHTDRFAISQIHDPDKIRALCLEHHNIAHQGLIENEEKSPQIWRIKKYAYGNNKFYEFTPKYEIDSIVTKKRSFP